MNIEYRKLYICSTTQNIEERRADHISKLNIGTGSFFHQAIGTYGPEVFQWEIIDTATDLNELALKESMHITPLILAIIKTLEGVLERKYISIQIGVVILVNGLLYLGLL